MENEEKQEQLKMAMLGLGAIILLFIFVFVVTNLLHSHSIGGQKKKLAVLEEYYQEKDYDAMDSYMDKIGDKYSSTYGKYYNTVAVYKGVKRSLEKADALKADILSKEATKETAAETLYSIFDELNDIKEIEDAGYRYGEEDAITELKAQLVDKLQTDLLLEEEEIEEGTRLYKDMEQQDFNKLGQIIINRFKTNKTWSEIYFTQNLNI